MGTVVFAKNSAALAAGMRWSVLGANSSKANAAIRSVARSVGATRYAIDEDGQQRYLGLYTPGPNLAGPSAKRRLRIHSLALTFIAALMAASDVERSQLHAVLVVTPVGDTQNDSRALVVIDGGRITHDGVETRGRAAEMLNEYRARGHFQVFADRDEGGGDTLIDWQALAGHTGGATLTKPIPRNPAVYGAVALGLLALAGQGAYYTLVTVPARQAEEARKRAEQDRTPQYVKALQEAMQQVDWATGSLIAHLSRLDGQTYWYKGWALKTLQCNANVCTETWSRHGGILTDLLAMREGGTYQAAQSMGDKVAVVQMPVNGLPGKLEEGDVLASGLGVHRALKPALNTLENAGATSQWGESSTWPVMPMTGVRPEVVVKRTRLEISYSYPFLAELLQELPPSFIAESFTVGMEQDFSVTVKGYVYEK